MSSAKVRSSMGLPKYQQVRMQLHDAIGGGRYGIGTQLPPERELARTFKVSPVTLRKALTSLTEEGMIRRVHGVGTFVLRKEPDIADTGRASSSPIRSIAWVSIETSSEHLSDYLGYNQAEARVLHERLAQEGYTLTMVYTNSREFASGRLPLALERGHVDGIILSGFVEDFHVHYLHSLGLPMVLIGNRPVHMPASHVEINSRSHAYLLTKALLGATEGPVYYITRPFDCYFTYELLAGYNQAVSESGGCSRVMVLTYTGNDERELREIMSQIDGPCGLFVNHNVAYELRSLYQELGWKFEDHPVAMVSELHRLNPDIVRQMNVCSPSVEVPASVAAELMMDVLGGGSPKKVVIEGELSSEVEDGVLRLSLAYQPVTIVDAFTEDSAVV